MKGILSSFLVRLSPKADNYQQISVLKLLQSLKKGLYDVINSAKLGEIVEKNPIFMPLRGIFIGIYACFDGRT
jgi:hypothetical protein